MNLQSLVANGVTIIGGMASLGAVFDNVLTTTQTRTKISDFLRRSRSTTTPSFFDYLALVNETVFRRYFSAPFFSIRYFATCALVSLISLLIVLVIQILAFGTGAFDQIEFSTPQITIFVVCILWNVVIDWVSIGQTQIFFEISEQQKRFSRALLLIASDIILTINFFTMLYSIPICVGIYLAAAIPQQLLITSTANVTEIKPHEQRIISSIFAKDRSAYITRFSATLKNGDEDITGASVHVTSDVPDVSFRDLLSLAQPTFNNVVLSSERYLVTLNDDNEEVRHPPLPPDSDEKKKMVEEQGAEEREDIGMKIPSFGNPQSLTLAFGAVYQQIDNVQDGFPEDIFSPLIVIPIDTLNQIYHAILSNDAKQSASTVLRGCGTRMNGLWKWTIKSDVNGCEAKLEFQPAELFGLRRAGEQINSVFSKTKIPLNVPFMTSLSVTALLYAAALFLFVARQLYQRLIAEVFSIEKAFLRAPLAIVGLLFGTVLFSLTLIF